MATSKKPLLRRLGATTSGGGAGFVEIFGALGKEHGSAVSATIDLGLTYALSALWQQDGVYFWGSQRRHQTTSPFLGLSAKF
jgi:hypothetical protein